MVASLSNLDTNEADTGQEGKINERSGHFALVSRSTAESETLEGRAECTGEKRREADILSFCFATGGRSHLQHLELGRNEPRGWIWPLGFLQLQFLLAFAPVQQAQSGQEQGPSQDSGGAGTHSLGGCSLQQGTPSALLPRPSRVRPSRPRERAPAAGESCLPHLPRRETMEKPNGVSGHPVPGPSCPRYPSP